MDINRIDVCIPRIKISATKHLVISESCFDSLRTYGGVIQNCLEAQEEGESVNKQPYFKTEKIEIKLENFEDSQKYENDEPSYIKFEEIDIKCEKEDQDINFSSHNLDEPGNIKKETFEDLGERKYEYMLNCETEVPIQKCAVPLDVSSYKNTIKSGIHHKIAAEQKFSSEILMYKCDTCDYKFKRAYQLHSHRLIHKAPSEIQMYKWDECGYESKRTGELHRHKLTHKDPSEIQMYKCNTCHYKSKRKSHLCVHQLTHRDPSEIQMYKCDICPFESKYKKNVTDHQLLHKDPLEIH